MAKGIDIDISCAPNIKAHERIEKALELKIGDRAEMVADFFGNSYSACNKSLPGIDRCFKDAILEIGRGIGKIIINMPERTEKNFFGLKIPVSYSKCVYKEITDYPSFKKGVVIFRDEGKWLNHLNMLYSLAHQINLSGERERARKGESLKKMYEMIDNFSLAQY